MSKKNEKLFLIGAAILVVIALILISIDYGYLGFVIDPLLPIDWEEAPKRYIVKNTIPLILQENLDGTCKVSTTNFLPVVNHTAFVHGWDLANKLNYDEEDETLLIPCEQMDGEKSRLHIWYVTEEAEGKFANKYEYFLTPWDVNLTSASPP